MDRLELVCERSGLSTSLGVKRRLNRSPAHCSSVALRDTRLVLRPGEAPQAVPLLWCVGRPSATSRGGYDRLGRWSQQVGGE